jgi:YidC/Oxa1 family membrane protein insertase
MGIFNTLLLYIEVPVSYVLVGWYRVFTFLGMDGASGWTWALSIVGLVITIRVILIPLFMRQIRSQRAMQLLAPDLKKVQAKYKGKKDQASREAMSRETMELYQKHKTNPFSSCLPLLVQSPIFLALFRVLNTHLKPDPVPPGTPSGTPLVFHAFGALTQKMVVEANHATIFGASISQSFKDANTITVKIFAAVLIVAMVATTFLTQRQITMKNMPQSALEGPMAQQQKMLMYMMPFIFVFSGPFFPIGVLIYWTTTNIWSMGQQYYVIKKNPTPGSEAHKAYQDKLAAKAKHHGGDLVSNEPEEPEAPAITQRPQPKRKNRKRK